MKFVVSEANVYIKEPSWWDMESEATPRNRVVATKKEAQTQAGAKIRYPANQVAALHRRVAFNMIMNSTRWTKPILINPGDQADGSKKKSGILSEYDGLRFEEKKLVERVSGFSIPRNTQDKKSATIYDANLKEASKKHMSG